MKKEIPKDIQKYLNDISIEIESNVSNFKVELKSFNNIFNFFENEYLFWNKISLNQGYIQYLKGHFNECFRSLENLISRIISFSRDQLIQEWSRIATILTKKFINQNYPIIYSVTPEGKFLFEMYERSQIAGDSAYTYFAKKDLQNLHRIDYFDSYLKSYEFYHQDSSKFIKRRKYERASLNDIRNKFYQILQQAHKESEDFKTKLLFWKDEFISENQKWQESKTNEIGNLITEKNKRFLELEDLYTEKLRLEGPVRYWKLRAEQLKSQSKIWLCLLSGIVALLLALLTLFLYKMPDSLKIESFKDNPEAIKVLLILATIITLAIYLVRTFSRLTFSSLHLQRDAEERVNLTMVFLALAKDEKISSEERSLVLQALFSRADTGLIKNDSSPSMPGISGIVEKILSK